jgi:hypothetical protein
VQTSSNLAGIPDNPPPVATIGQDRFDRGVISLINESKLPRNALKEADNLTLIEDGAPKPRPGINWYGIAPTDHPIDGAGMYVSSSDAVHLLIISNGTVYRSLDDGQTWDTCTGGSFTAGKKVRMEQANSYSYLFNGYDNIIRYDGTTTLVTYTALSTPVGNTPAKTGLAGTTYTYRYRVSAVNEVGYTIASPATLIQVDRVRASWNDTNFVTFTWTAVPGAVRYDIYVGQTAGEESYIDSVEGNATTTYIDKGQTIEQVAIVAPDSNTTQGPRAADMAMIGTRLYATADRDFPYRVWISGAGRFVGQFSSAYDATYIDLQKGGQFKPVKLADYRDGKGTPLATVWCKSKDGRGCIWQGSLDSLTVGQITFPVPNFYRLPGSRGTDAPDSVVNVLNDYMYYNSQAFYNLGSRAQFLNLLSTDESSANIRPDIQRIRQSASSKICAHFQDAKVYFSVPIGSDENSRTIVFDTERKAWLPNGFTVGFQRFFSYTDTLGNRHLLAWKPGDSRLSQISTDIRGDYGMPFKTSLITGLLHINPKNRFEFMWCEEGEVEFAQPSGEITIELSGITRGEGFRKIDERTIKPSSTKRSWTLAKWTTHKWTDTTVSALSYSEPSTKRYFNVQEDINAYQYRVTTFSLLADYILRTLQINGTNTDAGKPREWELFS